MKKYGVNELRRMFLEFFESKGHLAMKSFSLVPHNDNSLLLINSGDEKTAFFTEQRSWVRDRESAAVANSKKQSGSALEELEYIRSLRDLTRERVYDLAGRYETVLDKTE